MTAMMCARDTAQMQMRKRVSCILGKVGCILKVKEAYVLINK